MEKTPWGTPGGGGLGPSWRRLQTGAPPRGHASLWGWCRRPRVMAEAGRPGAGVPYSPWWLRTVRQPMQQFRRLAKARRPPTLPVSTVLQRVWSPPAGEGRRWVECQTGPPVPPPAPGVPPYAATRPPRGPRPEWARRCAGAAWRAAAPGSTVCRWAGCAPVRTGGPVGRAGPCHTGEWSGGTWEGLRGRGP